MEVITDKQDNLKSTAHDNKKETDNSRMIRPQVHTTKSGTQYVNVVDVIQSEAGWAEIERILDANLVQKPAPQNGANNSPPSNSGDDVA
jgi:hypothetical protein